MNRTVTYSEVGSDNSTVSGEDNWAGCESSTCQASALYCLPHLVFSVLASALLLAYGCCPRLRRAGRPYTLRRPCHHARWLLLLALLIVGVFAVLEGALSDLKSPGSGGSRPHLYLPACCALVATVLAGLLYHHGEAWLRSGFAWPLLGYWAAALVAEGTRLGRWVADPAKVDVRIVRFDTMLILVSVYGLLLLVELYAIFIMLCGKSNHLSLPEDLKKPEMKYYQRYASFPSQMVFAWQGWLLGKGFENPLELGDLGVLPSVNTTRHNMNIIEKHLQREMERASKRGGMKHFSLYRVLCMAFLSSHLTAMALKVVADTLNFVYPLMVSGIVTYATAVYYGKEEDDDQVSDFVTVGEFFGNGFVLMFIMTVVGLTRVLMLHTVYHMTILASVHLRAGMQAAVYNKTLRLSGWTVTSGTMTTGQITNLMSTDAMHLMYIYQFGLYIYSLPIMITVAMAMLYYLLGPAALVSCLCFAVAIPLQYWLAHMQAKYQKSALKISDERLKGTHEMLQGMKLVKLYGWEAVFCKAISTIRSREVSKLKKTVIFFCLSACVSYVIPAFVTLIGFALFIEFTGSSLTPAIAFTTLTIISQLRFPVRMFSGLMKHIINNHISVQRLNAFFTAKEVETETRIFPDTAEEGATKADEEEEGEEEETARSSTATPRVDARTGYTLASLDDGPSHSHSDGNSVTEPKAENYTRLETAATGDEERAGRPLPDHIAIKVDEGNFSWDPDAKNCTLQDIDIEFPTGSLTMIIGQVGMGKSSLLSALLGEMHTVSGSVQFNRNHRGGIAYSAQRAWLLNASLRDNILFGQDFQEKKFQAVVSACSLQPDIDILPAGDQTEIGEKGINLSGGQKQRVSVARAIYSRNDVVILDDPFSALDVHVGSHLFHEGILDTLLASKRTVVLVTHQLQYMKYANKVVVMRDGRASLQGTPAEVWAADPDLAKACTHRTKAASQSETESGDEEAEKERQILLKRVQESKKEQEKQANLSEEEGRLIEKEERNVGSLAWSVVVFYLRAMRYPLVGLLLGLTLLQYSLLIGTDFWLARWSEAGEKLELQNATEDVKLSSQQYYLYSYTSMRFAAAILSFAAVLVLFLAGIVAARHLHSTMLTVLSKVPMRFYDTTPIGRILNRFSSDVKVVDSELITSVMFMLECSFTCLAAIIVNSIVSPFFILVILPIGVCYFLLQRYYITSSRELQRIDSITKSPIFAHFSESLNGLSTIRAYRDESRFKTRLLEAIDQNTTAYIHINTCNRWLGVRLDTIGRLCVFLAGMTSLIVSVTSDLEPSYVGLALAYSLAAADMLNWFIRQISVVEMQMNAVERIKYYSHITTENYHGDIPESEWPSHGAVSIQDISVRYADTLKPVLQNLSVNIEPGQKVGICGRTGSGKSSLTLALFRIVDTFKGKILIDNVDIASLPLDLLRQKLSIIPQDPILFSGSIRFNLDPHGECDEDELWTALDISQLKGTVMELEAGLDSKVAEGGDNFSMGQRQLFCLARAFLRKSELLILDEATASIDMETDNIVQKVLTKEFSDRTILVIAHRITTILNSDRIMVLNEGALVEYDTPQVLLAREGSLFASFIRDTQRQ